MKKSTFKFLLVALALTFAGNLFAQENFIAGSITTLKGDVENGLIDYRNWVINPNSVAFKKNVGDGVVNYNANEIRSFNVLDEKYVGGIFKINNSPTKVAALSDSAGFSFRTDTVFLQILVQGKKSLYYYKDRKEDDHLFILQDTTIEELLYKRYIKYEMTISKILENKRYVGQLTLYLNECENIRTQLSNLQYSKTDITKLFKYYLKCTNTANDFEKEVEKMKVEIGVKAGLCISKLDFEGTSHLYLVNVDYPSTSNVAGGVFFNFVIPRNHGKFSIYSDLMFTSYNCSGTYADYAPGMVLFVRNTYVELAYSYIKLNAMLRYKFKLGNTFLFLNGGMSNGFVVSETNYKSVSYYYYNDLITEEGKAMDETRGYEQGWIMGLGSEYKKYSFEFRYENGNGMSPYLGLLSSTSRYYFLLGYRF